MSRKRKAVPDGATGLLFRAIIQNEPAEWSQMPFITRACALQIMRRLDGNNQIVCAPGKTPYDAVYLAFGAHPNERRRIREAIDELAANRWLILTDDRLTAHFPDLGGSRPERSGSGQASGLDRSGVGQASDASTVADNSANSLDTAPPITPVNVATVEKSRVEERTEEKRGEPRAHDRLAWRATELPLLAELKKHQIVFSELVGPSWFRVVNWVLDFSENGPPTSKIIEAMSRGFALNQKAKLHGYPLSYLVTNPRQYYDEGLRAGGPVEETYDDEEHPL